jgi:hypothetical protein
VRPSRRGLIVVIALTGLVPVPASAHVKAASGPYRFTLGWGEEPALSGSQNFVQVQVADRSGAPVRDPGDGLAVAVSFGGADTTLPLRPAGAPGELRAVMVPTRPGTYGFRLSGTLKGRPVDVRATCSAATFDCVTPASEVQFPTRDPSGGETAQAVQRALARADRAEDRADSARRVAIVAIVLAAAALAAGLGLGIRGRRKPG